MAPSQRPVYGRSRTPLDSAAAERQKRPRSPRGSARDASGFAPAAKRPPTPPRPLPRAPHRASRAPATHHLGVVERGPRVLDAHEDLLVVLRDALELLPPRRVVHRAPARAAHAALGRGRARHDGRHALQQRAVARLDLRVPRLLHRLALDVAAHLAEALGRAVVHGRPHRRDALRHRRHALADLHGEGGWRAGERERRERETPRARAARRARFARAGAAARRPLRPRGETKRTSNSYICLLALTSARCI